MALGVKHHMNHHIVPMKAMAEPHTQAFTSVSTSVASTAVFSL